MTLELDNLSLRYGDRILLERATLRIGPGEHVALMGVNGCGKTTLLRAIAGIPGAAAVGGAVRLEGAATAGRPAWVPQDAVPDAPLRADEFVMLGRTARLPRWLPPAAEDRRAVEEAMELTGTRGLAAARLSELSGGERQRLAVALALATGAELLLLDEPTSHLDLRYRRAILSLIDGLPGKTVLMALHDLEWARRRRRVLLFDGPALLDGPPERILTPETVRRVFGA